MDETGIGRVWKIGELAAEAGLTVRTLHHYDRIGLVCPAARTGTGHRRYTEADVRRLYRVLALRQIGLGLDRIAEALAGTVPMARVLAAHRDGLAARLTAMSELHAQVSALADTAEQRPGLSTDHFLGLIRRTAMIDDNHFTRENARAFATLYFAQLTARQGTLRFWYAADARLTLGDVARVGPSAIVDELVRIPAAGYTVDAVELEPDTETRTLFRVTGTLLPDRAARARPFEAEFTVNRSTADAAYLIADQTLREFDSVAS